MGVVGVSPRYAERVAHKFSQFWRLPPRAVKVRVPTTNALFAGVISCKYRLAAEWRPLHDIVCRSCWARMQQAGQHGSS